jgi:hypothetical protein
MSAWPFLRGPKKTDHSQAWRGKDEARCFDVSVKRRLRRDHRLRLRAGFVFEGQSLDLSGSCFASGATAFGIRGGNV